MSDLIQLFNVINQPFLLQDEILIVHQATLSSTKLSCYQASAFHRTVEFVAPQLDRIAPQQNKSITRHIREITAKANRHFHHLSSTS